MSRRPAHRAAPGAGAWPALPRPDRPGVRRARRALLRPRLAAPPGRARRRGVRRHDLRAHRPHRARDRPLGDDLALHARWPRRVQRRPALLHRRRRRARPRRRDRYGQMPALPADRRVRLLLHPRRHPRAGPPHRGRPSHHHARPRPLPHERGPGAVPGVFAASAGEHPEKGNEIMTPIGLFRDERALVTGSASNIGRAIALALAREGAAVRCVDIDAGRNAAVVEEIVKAGGAAESVTVDLSTADGWRAALPGAGQPIHLLVHSASPARRETDTALAVTEATWDAMVDTNVRSGFFIARELGRRMQDGGIKGRMLFITSLHAETPRNIPHYAAAKAGQTMVVKELARALVPAGIRANALAPGAVPGGGFNAAAFKFDGKIPLGRLGRPEDMADMATALLSDRFSGYVTGTTVTVDGGIALYNWIPLSAA